MAACEKRCLIQKGLREHSGSGTQNGKGSKHEDTPVLFAEMVEKGGKGTLG